MSVQGWHSTDPAFAELIEEVRPNIIIEVGSWRGASAIHMANLCDAHIYCVDTFLGSYEHHRDGWIQFGTRPRLFTEFLENTEPLRSRITPLPMTSSVAAKLLAFRGIHADLIYIDGSHEYEDVRRDIRDYWPLVNSGGAMFGDDIDLPDVERAVNEFGQPRLHGMYFWSFKKP